MLRRAASLLRRRPAAPNGGHPYHPSTAPPLPCVRHAHGELGGAPRVPLLGIDAGGARSYARMARRLPPVRPDGYSTSDGEADEPDPPVLEDDLEPRADVREEDLEDSEMEGFMLDFGSGSDTDSGGDEEEDAEERDK